MTEQLPLEPERAMETRLRALEQIRVAAEAVCHGAWYDGALGLPGALVSVDSLTLLDEALAIVDGRALEPGAVNEEGE